MEKTIQEAQPQQNAPEHAVLVPREECLVCASGYDPSVGTELFQEALLESV
jgi:hypothetical protein